MVGACGSLDSSNVSLRIVTLAVSIEVDSCASASRRRVSGSVGSSQQMPELGVSAGVLVPRAQARVIRKQQSTSSLSRGLNLGTARSLPPRSLRAGRS